MIQIDELIKDAMHQKNRDLLNVLKLIKAEFLKKQTEPGRKEKELNDEEQTKVLLKMASQREDSIKQYTNGGRQDLADAERKELEIIKQFTPKQPTDDELAEYTSNIVQQYVKDKTEGYKLSMKDMKPIMTMVKEKYPTANGKIVSQTLQKAINN